MYKPLNSQAATIHDTPTNTNDTSAGLGRRSFLQRGTTAGVAAMLPLAGLISGAQPASAAGVPPPGDIAILKYLAASEILAEDFWQQYAELANNNPGYKAALSVVDPASPRYAADTTDDERSHAAFINAYLESIGEDPVDLEPFRKLPSVQVEGADTLTRRLTSLTNLNVDTSWYLRYRSSENPDLGATFGQLVNIVNRPAIPISDNLTPLEMQVIAHTALFHFVALEVGGSNLYSTLTPMATHPTVLRILVSIGHIETYHFATFHKSLENLGGMDSGDGLVFPNLKGNPDLAQAVMPEPCNFLGVEFPLCSVIRPTTTKLSGAQAAVKKNIASGLFSGQSAAFLNFLHHLAVAADAA